MEDRLKDMISRIRSSGVVISPEWHKHAFEGGAGGEEVVDEGREVERLRGESAMLKEVVASLQDKVDALEKGEDGRTRSHDEAMLQGLMNEKQQLEAWLSQAKEEHKVAVQRIQDMQAELRRVSMVCTNPRPLHPRRFTLS